MVSDMWAVRRTLAAAIKKPCQHVQHEVLHHLGGAFDDHSLEFTKCYECGGFFAVTVYFDRANEDCVEIEPMSLEQIARYAPEYTEQVVHSRGAA
jgi:hypothetical protein